MDQDTRSAQKTLVRWHSFDPDRIHRTSWLLDTLVPEQSLVCLFGASNVGKTFIALDIALSVATGRPCFGQDPSGRDSPDAGKPRPVVFVLLEGIDAIYRRIAAWLAARGIDRHEGQALLKETFFIVDLAGMLKAVPGYRFEAFIDAVLDKVSRPALIVLDPLVEMLRGDENSAHDMGAFVTALRRLRERTGSSVLVIHHQGKSASQKIERGSSALRAGMDTHIGVSPKGPQRGDGSWQVVLDVLKQREARRAETLTLDMRPVRHIRPSDPDELGAVPFRTGTGSDTAPVRQSGTERRKRQAAKQPDGRSIGTALSLLKQACRTAAASSEDGGFGKSDVMKILAASEGYSRGQSTTYTLLDKLLTQKNPYLVRDASNPRRLTLAETSEGADFDGMAIQRRQGRAGREREKADAPPRS